MDSIIYRNDKNFPVLLGEINDPPKKLFIRAKNEEKMNTALASLSNPNIKILCIVGARKYSSYGKEVTEKLIGSLSGYNICIVSGLALGIDSIAHRAALENGLQTIAFPGSGLHPSILYPPSHKGLAEEIVEKGGLLFSEFEMMQEGAPWTFPSRNRLMAGISHATLVIEAEKKSGTLITSKYATDYNRDVGAVPGPIFSSLSEGPHMLIRLGATPITCGDDLLEFLGYERKEGKSTLDFNDKTTNQKFLSLGEKERSILQILKRGSLNKDTLVREAGIEVQKINMLISFLEIEGYIKEEDGVVKMK